MRKTACGSPHWARPCPCPRVSRNRRRAGKKVGPCGLAAGPSACARPTDRESPALPRREFRATPAPQRRIARARSTRLRLPFLVGGPTLRQQLRRLRDAGNDQLRTRRAAGHPDIDRDVLVYRAVDRGAAGQAIAAWRAAAV